MSLPTVALSLGGCFLYVCSMSALGRLLAVCRERSSAVYIAPVTQQRIGA